VYRQGESYDQRGPSSAKPSIPTCSLQEVVLRFA
jgi:hypothetical protein